jgi:pyrimidine operon attenuation protein / uracil phosphoribosyltransferase
MGGATDIQLEKRIFLALVGSCFAGIYGRTHEKLGAVGHVFKNNQPVVLGMYLLFHLCKIKKRKITEHYEIFQDIPYKFACMPTEPLLILNASQMKQKLNRLAYQVYENNFEEKELLICGLAERGYLLAEQLHHILKGITPFPVSLHKVVVDKENPTSGSVSIQPEAKLKGKSVILCDDVLYTGRTLAYAALPFLNGNVKKLQCLVLIHRNHLTFPVQPTYIGMSLATTLQEHVNVKFGEQASVHLV